MNIVRCGNPWATLSFLGALALGTLASPPLAFAQKDWDGGGGNTLWSNALNWAGDSLPGAADTVRNLTNLNISYNAAAGASSISSFLSSGTGTFAVNGGSLSANQPGISTFQVDSTFTMSGGTLSGFVVNPGVGGQGVTFANNSSNFFNGITANANLNLATATGIGRIANGLTLNGTASINSNSLLTAENTQTWGGTGFVTFGNTGANNRITIEGSSTLTLGSGITIQGQNGTIGGPVFIAGNNSLVNNGKVSANVAGGLITINLNNAANNSITNNATLEAVNGGTLAVQSNITQGIAGQIRSDGANSQFRQNGARITNGVISTANGGSFVATNTTSNFLSNVTLNGSLDLATATGIERIQDGLILNGAININSNSILTVENSLTISGNGTINLGNTGASNRISIEGSNTLTIGANTVIQGQNGTIGGPLFTAGNNALVNNGKVSANVAGGLITINLNNAANTAITNNGTLEAANGGTLAVQTNITQGVNGQIRSDGTNSQFRQNGARITNGTINVVNNGSFVPTNTSSNFLSNVTFNGNMDLATATGVERIVDGLTLNGQINLNSNSILSFENTQTLSGNGTIQFGATGGNNRITIEGSNTLTLGSGITIQGQNGTIGGPVFVAGNNALVNNGKVSANVAGGLITINLNNAANNSITNNGTLEATNGGTLVVQSNITQSISGQLRADGTNSRFQQTGSRITNGSINVTNGGSFVPTNNSSNFLSNVTINGNVDLATAVGVERILDGLTLNGAININSNSILAFENTQTVSGTGAIQLGATGANNRVNIEGASTLTLGSGITIQGQNGTIGSQQFVAGANGLINQGTIAANVSGGLITVNLNGSGVNNQGTLRAEAGATLRLVENYTQNSGQTIANGIVRVGNGTGTANIVAGALMGGTATVAGTFDGNVNNTGGTVSAGQSPGLLTIDGNLTQGAGATFLVELGGTIPGQFDFVDVNGLATLAGTLQVDLFGVFAPTAIGQTFRFLDYNSRIGEFTTLVANSPGYNPGFAYTVDYFSTFAELRVIQLGSPINGSSSAPEPGSIALALTGGIIVVFRRWKRA